LTVIAFDEFVAERQALELEQQRKSRRAEAARVKYRADKANGVVRIKRVCETTESRKPRYDAEDYAEEWRELTAWGVSANDIILRSNPSRRWFFDHVRPLVNDAICSSCGGHFNPSRSHMLTKCDKTCGLPRPTRQVVSLWDR
jgi:hypothetical protein